MLHSLSRRAALKASGVTIALPLLESLDGAVGADLADSPKRMVLICNTLGLYPPSLYPRKTGVDYPMTGYLKLLQEHRRNFTLFSGLSHPDQHGKEPHDTEMTWLTSARNPGLGGFKNTISVDQYAAEKLGHVTRFRSIALSTNTQESQSYTGNGVMLPAEDKPSKLFEKLFLKGSPAEVNRKRQSLADGRSILDFVGGQADALRQRASRNDHRKLEEYFDAIRKAELELAEAEAWIDRAKPKIGVKKPEDIADRRDLIGRTEALFNLIPLILQSDSSRIITMVIQDHGVVPMIKGVSAGHHPLSHHGQDPEKIKQLQVIESQLLRCFNRFLTR
ncbi:MAG: DUF1552 domain-containing protein, partial [Planctomycetota bacterium]|nr:DUF1552 domain-containing protein [Planctomycetota bacterium]